MAQTLKVLGQASPIAATLTALYTVPSATQVCGSTIVICNQNAAGNIRFRVSIAVAGAADAPRQYIYYDGLLSNRSTFTATIGIALGATDVVRVQSDTLNVSFNLFGVEVT